MDNNKTLISMLDFIKKSTGMSDKDISKGAGYYYSYISQRLSKGEVSKNNFIADGKPGIKPFGHGFFSKRFYKIRKLAGLSNDYTIYGFKHTRVVHLKIDGATDAEIMALTGHSDYSSFAKYLRDIGIGTDLSKLDILTRRI